MKNIESEIYKFLAERDRDKLRPSDLAKSICIEAEELLEIFQWINTSIEETKRDPSIFGHIRLRRPSSPRAKSSHFVTKNYYAKGLICWRIKNHHRKRKES